MGLTKQQVADKVIARLVEQGEKEDGLLSTDISSWIDEALQRLARRVANTDEYRELQKTIPVTITSGLGTISDQALMMDTISQTGLVISSTSVLYKWVPRVESLRHTFAGTDVGHYAIIGYKVYVKDEAGSLTPNLTLNITCSAVPTVGTGTGTDLPTRFENGLIDVMIEMSAEKRNNRKASQTEPQQQ